MNWILCIDFGTAYSKAAAAPLGAWSRFNPGDVRPLMLNPHGGNAFLLDSAVLVDDHHVLLGRLAVEREGALISAKRTALRSFKTLLGVSDLDRALQTSVSTSIDPHRIFVLRDLVVLYLAFLRASIDQAVRMDADLIAGQIELRYAAPAWRSGDSAGLHDHVVRLFGEADAVRQRLGDSTIAAGAIPLDDARAAIEAARGAAGPPMGLIYEASAAAAYSSVGIEASSPNLLVVDMGAGTTDFAALSDDHGAVELLDARVTLKQAGDFIDSIIANIALDSNRSLKTDIARTEFWRALMRDIRDFKTTLFAEGRASFRFGNRTTTVSMRDIERDKDFRAFQESLVRAFEHSFTVLRPYAQRDRNAEVHAVAVGGGAAAPFIQALIRRKPRDAGKMNLIVRPVTPRWAHAPEFRGNLAPVFPQLAISMGGALAPDSMIAAFAQVSPDASGRSDTPAARD